MSFSQVVAQKMFQGMMRFFSEAIACGLADPIWTASCPPLREEKTGENSMHGEHIICRGQKFRRIASPVKSAYCAFEPPNRQSETPLGSGNGKVAEGGPLTE
jgi:hypothetical protein